MMHSLILIVAFLFTVLASPTLRHRLVQEVDTDRNLDDLEGNIFDTFTSATAPDLGSANPEGTGWTALVGTTPDPQGYQDGTVGDNIYVGAPELQNGLLIAKTPIGKHSLKPTPDNPCPNLYTLCSKTLQYFTLFYITDAYPYNAAADLNFEKCDKGEIHCCMSYREETRRGGSCYNAYS